MPFYKNCLLCPRRCGADRDAGRRGYCGETAELRLAFAGIHKGEEPPIAGKGGSGTIFVSGCNLGCAFCQNFQISQGDALSQKGMGRPVSAEEFAEICLALGEKGAENINIVTGSHAAPALAKGIETARKQGLRVPVLWNSSGYDGLEMLEILKDIVDVYLPDLKTLDAGLAAAFFRAPDYPERASRAILKMMEYRKLSFAPAPADAAETGPAMGTLVSGVMIRHLVIPGRLEAARQVLAWFAEHCAGDGPGDSRALLSLMTQYTPVRAAAKTAGPGEPIPDRYVSEREYDAVLSMLEEFGIDDGFCQELAVGSDWLPDFEKGNPFSSELSVPVWHWREGALRLIPSP